MSKIGAVEILNEFTYNKLEKVFKGKTPTDKTVLLMRLFAERNINTPELLILQKEKISSKVTGLDLLNSTYPRSTLYEKIQRSDKKSIVRTIDLLNT